MEQTETAASAPSRLNLLAGAILLLGLVIFGWAAPANFYVYKMLHVVCAVVWVGGGVILTILAMLVERENDPHALAALARKIEVIAKRVFIPTSLLVLLFGILMVVKYDFDWGQFWLIAGLVGFAMTFVTGLAVLTPQIERFNTLGRDLGVDAPETQAALRRLLLIARFDQVVLLLVVADMVAKPFS